MSCVFLVVNVLLYSFALLVFSFKKDKQSVCFSVSYATTDVSRLRLSKCHYSLAPIYTRLINSSVLLGKGQVSYVELAIYLFIGSGPILKKSLLFCVVINKQEEVCCRY